MAGWAHLLDEHYVESHRQPGKLRPRQKERGGRARNAPALPRRHSGGGIGGGGAGLYLDDREHLAAPRDYVDLAGRAAPVAGNDAPQAQPQVNAAEQFRQIAAPTRALAPQPRVGRTLHHPCSGFSRAKASARS